MIPSCIWVKGARRRSDNFVRFLIRRSKFRLALRAPISKNKLASPIPVEVIKKERLPCHCFLPPCSCSLQFIQKKLCISLYNVKYLLPQPPAEAFFPPAEI